MSEQELSPIAQLEIYKKGIAWERERILKLLEDAEVLCTETTTCYDFDADGVCDCDEFRSLVEGK